MAASSSATATASIAVQLAVQTGPAGAIAAPSVHASGVPPGVAARRPTPLSTIHIVPLVEPKSSARAAVSVPPLGVHVRSVLALTSGLGA
jgi:hypothetical protein